MDDLDRLIAALAKANAAAQQFDAKRAELNAAVAELDASLELFRKAGKAPPVQ